MMIEAIETYYFDYPLKHDFHPAWIPGHAQTANRCVILKLIADNGLEGIGALSVFNEEQARLGKFIAEETIGRFLIGLDPNETELVARLAAQYGFILGGRPWLIETAAWDLVGKAAGQPLYKLWGGATHRLELYASTGEVVDLERSPKQALAARDAGFRAIKLRAHNMDIAEDIRAIRAVRAAVGDSMKIMVDANQGWTLSPLGPRWDFDTALRFVHELKDTHLAWLEEPLDRFDYDGLARLRGHGVPIAGGEMNQGLHEFKILLEKDSLDVYQPDATLAGGPIMAREVARLAEQKGRIFSPHTWTNGIGFALNLHIAAAAGNCPILEFPWEPESWDMLSRDAMLATPFLPDHGKIDLPVHPGLGIELNPDTMKEFAKRL